MRSLINTSPTEWDNENHQAQQNPNITLITYSEWQQNERYINRIEIKTNPLKLSKKYGDLYTLVERKREFWS